MDQLPGVEWWAILSIDLVLGLAVAYGLHLVVDALGVRIPTAIQPYAALAAILLGIGAVLTIHAKWYLQRHDEISLTPTMRE